jgi:hypothetical protein
MTKRILRYLLAESLSFPAILAYSQVVNIESARMQSDTTGWMGSAGATFEFIKTTENVTQVNLRSHIQYKTQRDLWLILGHYGFLKGGPSKFVNHSFGHLRYNRKLNKWLRWEVFTQAQNNYVTMIESRWLFGTGPRFKIADTRSFHLYVACLFMYEYEKERIVPHVFHNDIRNSSYVSFTIRAGESTEIISTTFYQPLLKKMSDFRILNEAVLKVRTGKHLAMTVEWNYLHDRFPAANAPGITYDLGIGIQYDF